MDRMLHRQPSWEAFYGALRRLPEAVVHRQGPVERAQLLQALGQQAEVLRTGVGKMNVPIDSAAVGEPRIKLNRNVPQASR